MNSRRGRTQPSNTRSPTCSVKLGPQPQRRRQPPDQPRASLVPCRGCRLVRKSKARWIVLVIEQPGTPPPKRHRCHRGTGPADQTREEARTLVARDPALARDLRIGRPDLPRQYDDGGLVDINTAPPSVIAQCCGLDDRAAEQIERARRQHPVPFQSVDELLAFAELDASTWA
ncbi:hypothetical protein CKY47_25705 [Saccharothrix yanglingensis]|uniref:DUF433 domain-containing protein n=1 Tax=Saccharothrix yanglingensis TaxID=659496 RepID=A0ABU0X5C5_9PSEU|nr:hypothetical protein [Saccharothrix yanglingensis]